MAALAHLEKRGRIAVIAIDNPPVNTLGAAAIAALMPELSDAENDPEVDAVVLTGSNGTFSGGADIKAFASATMTGPTTRDAIDRIEAMTKPVVAAIAGLALGGGLELSLGCDYRVAAPRARLGVPETKLGLLPGAGGTQRLPRLIGVEAALDLILDGEPIGAERALELGLIDRIAAGDVIADAVAFAHTLAGVPRRIGNLLAVKGDRPAINAARRRVEPEERGGLAAHRAIDAVQAALDCSFSDGLKAERRFFEELRASEQSKARIHLFFAEREAARAESTQGAAPIATAVVLGAGTMGTGIAMALANGGITTTLVDLQSEVIERARTTIEGNYAATARKGKLSEAQMAERLGRITYATSFAAAANVDLVIEAVFEEMELKRDVFRQIDAIARPGTLLATNTSTLDVDAIAAATQRPADVLGLHFFSPANVMKLLEIVRGKDSAPATIARAQALAKQLKKIGVVSGNCDGFIGNRMLKHYKREADFLLEEGASPQQVDRVIKAFGFPMGPFTMFDLAGIDVSWRIRKRRNLEVAPTGRYSKLEDEMCEMGRFGQKTGAGFYRYEPGSRTPIPDPIIDDLIEANARDGGIERRPIEDLEIRKRCLYPLINEAANILADGIAARPGDIDVVWVYGYGFPAFRGGPLRYADTLGLRDIYDDMLALEKIHGANWTPSPLLAHLATSGGTFGSWTGERAWATAQ